MKEGGETMKDFKKLEGVDRNLSDLSLEMYNYVRNTRDCATAIVHGVRIVMVPERVTYPSS